ncbi:MAG: PIN domain-containing protein [Myxococcaceae bacterium]|nr:PIN domain-containing protein [Myxococcaceae bacterium]MCI0673647.1 PIN domain-containing protein [Myxococcaceae bacterium]
MIAVDTNILVYAHREDSPWHERARACLEELGSTRAPWAIPWPCIHEFLAVVTHPRIYAPPTPLAVALESVSGWMRVPTLKLLSEVEGYWDQFVGLTASAHVAGPMVHDARIAAICLHHGVRELWTADRDFGRFPKLRTRNPLVT